MDDSNNGDENADEGDGDGNLRKVKQGVANSLRGGLTW